MKNVIVTGACGFVGSSVVKELVKHGIRVIALDIADFGKCSYIDNDLVDYYKCDVFNIDSFKNKIPCLEYDCFYHFAWIGSAGPKREDFDCQINNAKSTLDLLVFAKDIGCKKFIVAGTIMEFETFSAIYAQGNKPQMSYLYGVGKQLAHSLCKPVANKINIDLVWAYITNAYGIGEKSPRLINTTIRKCIQKEELLFTSGTQNYDFVYIDDVARAFFLIGEKGMANNSYIIGSGKAGPLRGFLEKLVMTCDKNLVPNFGNVPFTGVDLPLETFSIKQIREDCGFEPQISFENGIKRTYEWILKEEK